MNDVREVLKIAVKIGVELGENDLTKVYRIGTRPRQEQGERTYNRMMCVQFKDMEKKWEFLANAKYLKENCEDSGQDRHLAEVYVVPYLTVKQREDRKKLREALIKRQGEGEQDLVIRGGRIIKKSARTQ